MEFTMPRHNKVTPVTTTNTNHPPFRTSRGKKTSKTNPQVQSLKKEMAASRKEALKYSDDQINQMQKHNIAEKINPVARGYLARKRLEEKKLATKKIQRNFRDFLKNKEDFHLVNERDFGVRTV